MGYTLPYFGHTIADAAKGMYQGEDLWVALGCFLNDWWSSAGNKRETLISKPPPPATTPTDRQWAAFCAATVEELCRRASLASPAWTNRQEYFLAEPWFFDSQPEQRAWLLSNTLEPYKRRNIFVGSNVLDNKYELKNIFGDRPRWSGWTEEELRKYQPAE